MDLKSINRKYDFKAYQIALSLLTSKKKKWNFQLSGIRIARIKGHFYLFLTYCNVDSSERMFPSFPLDHCCILLSMTYIVYRNICLIALFFYNVGEDKACVGKLQITWIS